jgi:hypothetical protein
VVAFGSGIRDGKKSDPESGINIPDPQHWRLPMTLFPSVLRKEYFDCPERLFRSTLHLIEGGEGSLYPRTLLAVQGGSVTAV